MRYTGNVYKTDGTFDTFDIPEEGCLEVFQSMVGGYIERVPLYSIEPTTGEIDFDYKIPHDMLVNEEGLLLGLPVNPFSDVLTTFTNFRNTPLVGNIICVNGGLREAEEDEEGEE